MTARASLTESLCRFDPDADTRAAVALRVEVPQREAEQPLHRHRKGQLVMALRGGVTCSVPKAMWMVPPQHAVWIPGGMPHSNRATDNASICFLFIEPGAVALPDECCTLSISPLVRELILHLADQPAAAVPDEAGARLAQVLLDQVAACPLESLHLPVSGHPKIRRMVDALAEDPANRMTLADWAARLALSDRSLARLVKRETGLTFGRWRQQLHMIVALRQLSAGMTVQQVAGNLGYDSVTAFITMFKKAVGQPPGQYFAALR
ncbi:AraC family transcriptional regulator [Bordetella genomosp. 1]|uniref:AraC family transcriptional regulator n=1 Tax=Bordetella genomosp. 1 TaxID=1395607 RepID=A0ABX4EY63_9BORD|nr:helix-turn-helix transcriptional regulator [Bordetella genomosp. 1]OZI64041.1 AraC family transcriptional regulator [Bordetella genomosp. 1]